MAPSMGGIVGLVILGAFVWWFQILPGLLASAIAVFMAHVAFSTFGYVEESSRLEAAVAAATSNGIRQ
jgi:hypothetical protein